MPDRVIREAEALRRLCVRAFQKLDVDDEDARIAADILVTANLRGVASHGVAHLRRYVNGLRTGTMVARPQVRVLAETPATAALDAGAGLGHPVAFRAMQRAIDKARAVGAGFVTVRNSNYYGTGRRAAGDGFLRQHDHQRGRQVQGVGDRLAVDDLLHPLSAR